MPDRWLPEFEWDESNEGKLLARHDVSAAEAEECFANPHSKRRLGPDLGLLGMTDGGRPLFLMYEQKAGGVVRVYSARRMTDGELRAYHRTAK